MLSSPDFGEPMAIGIKRIPNGAMSRDLVDHAKPGDEILTIGAAGFFILPDNIADYNYVFLFAAGSGITPILSLLKTALYAHPHLTVILFYSAHSRAGLIYYDQIDQLKKEYMSRLHLHYFTGDIPNLLRARLNRELVAELLEHHIGNDLGSALFYICGPVNYMRMCTYALQELGVNPAQIKKEDFVTDKKKVYRLAPPDKEQHTVTLNYHGKEYQFKVQYPDTILRAAKKEGIELPYSCEVGSCGNCAAYCTHGTVWLSNNEVLTENELKVGLTLTCVGYPVFGDVKLKI